MALQQDSSADLQANDVLLTASWKLRKRDWLPLPPLGGAVLGRGGSSAPAPGRPNHSRQDATPCDPPCTALYTEAVQRRPLRACNSVALDRRPSWTAPL